MKAVQYNKDSESVVITDDTTSSALNVGGMGPHSIAVQVTLSSVQGNSTTGQLQGSLDGVNFFNLGSAINITANGVQSVYAEPVYYKYYRMSYLTTPVKSALVDQSLTYTAVSQGPIGDTITITLQDPLANDEPLAISVVDTDIVVTLATDGIGAITTTGNALKTALNADPEAAALILVSGSNASVLTALVETPLAGADGYFTVVERKLVYGSTI